MIQFTQDSMQAVLVLSPPTFLSWDGIKAVEALETADMKEYQKNMTKVIRWTKNACLQMKFKFMAEYPLSLTPFKVLTAPLDDLLKYPRCCPLAIVYKHKCDGIIQGGGSAWSLRKGG